MTKQNFVIIVAGGKGLRMGTEIPKQFICIDGLPILMRTIMRFREYDKNLSIILVLPKDQQSFWLSLCKKHNFNEPYEIADGGETRFHSVKNGLKMIPDNVEGVVGVHDGVRPFVSIDVIDRCYQTALKTKTALPVISVVETLRHITDGDRSETVSRDCYRLVQTPQTFDIQLLKKAYTQPFKNVFTDDASVVEALGYNVKLIEGNRENIKITTPFDLNIAKVLMTYMQ
ncbi:MAG: 2-C-methyl-D-erythritol 4-phosphate cytidylyltransferase [Paraprevotella sp.]|nr:2-C-methyl-D-erythritol 4-phosphate cytidylyltransferase [Paraprevotella sp.]